MAMKTTTGICRKGQLIEDIKNTIQANLNEGHNKVVNVLKWNTVKSQIDNSIIVIAEYEEE